MAKASVAMISNDLRARAILKDKINGGICRIIIHDNNLKIGVILPCQGGQAGGEIRSAIPAYDSNRDKFRHKARSVSRPSQILWDRWRGALHRERAPEFSRLL